MTAPGTLWVISAPSGGGKTSLVNTLVKEMSDIQVSVSHTTRAARQGEENGKNYFFIDESTFADYVKQQVFLEYAQVFKHQYGTSKQWVMQQLQQGIDVILEIDWQGARKIREQMACRSIFILPPSRQILRSRLESRQQDSQEVIAHRMNQASEEISHYDEYDFVVINDDFANALADLMAIIRAQRLSLPLQQQRYQGLIESLNG